MAWQCFSWVKHWASFFLRKSSASKSCTSVAEPRTVPIPPKETSENVLAASNSDQTRDDLVASVDERLEAVNRAKVESSGSDHKIDGRSRPAPVAKQEAELERGTVANRAHSDILPGNKHTTTSKPPGPASALQSQTNLPIQSVLARDDGEAVLMSEAPVPRRERKPSLTTSGQVISGNGTGPSKAFEGVDLNRAPTIVVGDSGSYTLPGVRHGKEIANLDRTVTALGVTPPGVRMHATGMDLFAVFDGQGDYGRQVVELLSAQLAGVVQHTVRGTGEQNMSLVLEEAFASLDHQLQASGIDVSLSGCAGTVAISVCDRLIVGNVGNCSALIGSERGGRWVRTELSVCHDLTSASERDRLVNHGATLCRSETQLDSKEEVLLRRTLKGQSQGFVCTRFLGLSEGNNVGLHSRPEIFVRTLRPEDKFLIICSDGVWNHLSGEEAVDLVRAHTSAQEAAWELASEARRRSKLSSMMKNYSNVAVDNVTALVVFFVPAQTIASPEQKRATQNMSRNHFRAVGLPTAIDVPSDVISTNFELWMMKEEKRVKAAQQVREVLVEMMVEEDEPSGAAAFPTAHRPPGPMPGAQPPQQMPPPSMLMPSEPRETVHATHAHGPNGHLRRDPSLSPEVGASRLYAKPSSLADGRGAPPPGLPAEWYVYSM